MSDRPAHRPFAIPGGSRRPFEAIADFLAVFEGDRQNKSIGCGGLGQLQPLVFNSLEEKR